MVYFWLWEVLTEITIRRISLKDRHLDILLNPYEVDAGIVGRIITSSH
jgi:hypothetical protein